MSELMPQGATAAQGRRLALLERQIRFMREYAQLPASRPQANWLLKEAIFRMWEAPNLKAPKFGKYSLHLPWSPRAYERLVGWKPGKKPQPSVIGLRFEHLVPRR